MFCSKCGSELIEGAVFCQKCGAKVVYSDVVQQPLDNFIPDAKDQQDSEAEDTQQAFTNSTAKAVNYEADDSLEESDKMSKSEKAINKIGVSP